VTAYPFLFAALVWCAVGEVLTFLVSPYAVIVGFVGALVLLAVAYRRTLD
jgi:hypothetical protein